MSTGKELYTDAARKCYLGPDDHPQGSDCRDLLSCLNSAISLLNLEGLFFHTLLSETVAAPSAEYLTIGPDITATINGKRPCKIRSVYYRYSGATPYKLDQVAFQDVMGFKWATNSVGVPSIWAYQPDFPIGKIHFDRIPMPGGTITVQYTYVIDPVTDDTEVTIPPEYFSAITWLTAFLYAQRQGLECVQTCRDAFEFERSVIERNSLANTPSTVSLMQMNKRIGGHTVWAG